MGQGGEEEGNTGGRAVAGRLVEGGGSRVRDVGRGGVWGGGLVARGVLRFQRRPRGV